MEKLEVFIINLFMIGEDFSTYNSSRRCRDTTTIQCDGFTFKFKQIDISLKQQDFLNQTKITTKITIENVEKEQVERILEIIDNICWLLSFTQQTPICRHGYKISSYENWITCKGVHINPINNIIENSGNEIRQFLEQTYPIFQKLKYCRQLTVVFSYLCEAQRNPLALEASLILHYVLIENLKHTFALDNQYEYSGQYFIHKNFPHLENPPQDIENYWPPKGKRKKYIHKVHGQVTSTEMTLRMFETANLNRVDISPLLTKRHKMIHEGILLPFGDINYSKQALEDLHNVSDLLRYYLLTLLNYKGSYSLSRDRIGCSGSIN